MAGSFRVIPFPEKSDIPTDIGFRQLPNVPVSKEDTAFAAMISSRLRTLKRLINNKKSFETSEIFRANYQRLLGAAMTGVDYPNGNIGLGESALKDFEENSLVDLGRTYRNQFFRIQTTYLIVIVIVALISVITVTKLTDNQDIIKVVISASYGLLGIALSVFLAALWRNQTIKWYNIEYLDRDGYPPWLRLLGVALLGVVVMFLLHKKAFILGLGATPLNEFLGDPENSILIGFLCGLSELPVIKLVQKFFDNPTVNTR